MSIDEISVSARWGRGTTFVWAPVGIITLAAVLSFAVDLGRVQSAKTQLQTVADAAARYAARGISDGTWLAKAQAAAAENLVDGQPLNLSADDVHLGVWDPTTRTFTPTTVGANAVRVVAKRHGTNGIPTTLLGISANQRINVTAQAIVMANSGPKPIVLYEFKEGSGSIAYDTSGFTPEMNLTIQHPGHVTWLPGGGIQINSATKLQTTMSTSRVRNAIAASGRCTIFVHVRPANLTQTGPARFVTYSPDVNQRNFMIGQHESQVRARLRTTATDANGMSPQLESDWILSATEDTRVVLRYNGTHRHLFVKSGNATSTISTATSGNLTNWNSSWKILVGNEDTNDRAFLGRIYRIEIYDESLLSSDVNTLLNGGTLGSAVTVR